MPDGDRTFDDLSLYGSKSWVAARLGISTSTLTTKQTYIERDGFPRKDPLLGMWIKADVDAWVEKRRRFKKTEGVIQEPEPEIDEGAL